MISDKKANELAWNCKAHHEKMIARGFTSGQVAITNTMMSISQYISEEGPGAGISVMTACLNAIMSDGDVNITNIKGYHKNPEQESYSEEESDVEFKIDGDWLDEYDEEEEEEYIAEGNVLYHNFNPKED